MYKLELICVKYVPILIALITLIDVILYYFDIDFELINYIADTSFLTMIPMYISSYVYKFCEYHNYIVVNNAQYHDYCELFKAWFGDSVDSKIIESAINFWFKDDDFKSGCKVWKYFNMMQG